ncbi:MAG: hypothetical protein KGI79_01045 [Patescibacteria group bacterium]|nr:hypothetical protein [Patescibacteria group bacterium]MDE2116443.1 hypothetical protein [Patescibacteria group bacterium]
MSAPKGKVRRTRFSYLPLGAKFWYGDPPTLHTKVSIVVRKPLGLTTVTKSLRYNAQSAEGHTNILGSEIVAVSLEQERND